MLMLNFLTLNETKVEQLDKEKESIMASIKGKSKSRGIAINAG
jgi:hypothetical protein